MEYINNLYIALKMKTIDTTGLRCPMPLIETKKALSGLSAGEELKIVIDNETSVKNVTHYLEDNGIDVAVSKKDKNWELHVNKGEQDLSQTIPEEYCDVPGSGEKSYIVMFAKNRIGEGSEELGEKLVGSMLESLKAQDSMPEKIIFMNSGIHLVTEGSAVLPQLVELELNGVELIACGTCLNYFKKADQLAIGRVSNMFEIVELMRRTGQIINI